MTIYIITGFTDNIGVWEVELFSDYTKARNTFNYYVEEYQATVDDTGEDVFATCDKYAGWFSLEKRVVK